jgi:integrase-like protein
LPCSRSRRLASTRGTCEQTGRRWAGARTLAYGNTERKLSVSGTDGTRAPDRFRFPKTGTIVFLVRRTGISPWSAKTHRSPNTHKRYAVSAKSLVGFCGNLPLIDLTPGMVERYKLWRLGQCGPTGVNRDLAALRFMLNFAIRLGYIKDNPVTGVKMLAEPQDRVHVLSY